MEMGDGRMSGGGSLAMGMMAGAVGMGGTRGAGVIGVEAIARGAGVGR
jgi:hypothetical protein